MPATDEKIRKDVEGQLNWDSRVERAEIHVQVEDGVVTLTGVVPSFRVEEIAYSDAWNVKGVTDVIDNLAVSGQGTGITTDEELKESAENALRLEGQIDVSNIDVKVDGCRAFLEGTVASYSQKMRAAEVVSAINGLVLVKNHLRVEPSRETTDEAIRGRILTALENNPLIDIQGLQVEVKNGIVTLAGAVNTWSARRAAQEAAAYTYGVIDIRNHLTISTG